MGDLNPLHHDAAFAAASRYGGLIASGAHTSALLAGVLSRGFDGPAQRWPARSWAWTTTCSSRGPVRVGRAMWMEWEVIATEPHRSGTKLRVAGRIVEAADEAAVAVTAELTLLYFAA